TASSLLPSSNAWLADGRSAARETQGRARSATQASARATRLKPKPRRESFDVSGFKRCMDELFDRLDLHSVGEVDLAGCAQSNEIALAEAAGDLGACKVDHRVRSDLHGCADELVVDDLVDVVDRAFSVQGFARNAEHVVVSRGGDPDGDVGIGQQVAARVINGDEALADIARAVGDDG